MDEIWGKLLSFLISLAATTVGAVAGIGGGMIIRPVLTMLGFTKELSSFTSSMTVMSMSLVNLPGARRAMGGGMTLNTLVLMAVGSMLGGMAGASLMRLASAGMVNGLYAIVLAILVVLTMSKSRMRVLRLKNPVLKLLLGGATGVMSGFFGIGGGPFQMTALTALLGEDAKDAAAGSIFITMLTTLSSLITYSANGYADMSVALYTMPAGLIGGLLGARMRKKAASRTVSAVFIAVVAGMLLLQMRNLLAG